MPAQPCVNHPNEQTFIRCGRCDRPFCVRCLVDTPVGKKCRPCAENRTHLEESSAGQVARAFLAATAVAIPAGWVMQQFPIVLLALPYGWLVAEVARLAAQRSRSTGVQIVTGIAAALGGLLGAAMRLPGTMGGADGFAFHWLDFSGRGLLSLLATALGVAVAVSRVRYL